MDIRKHITNLEISKLLKEVGVPQNSLFYWVKNVDEFILLHFPVSNPMLETSYSAYLSTEIAQYLNLFEATPQQILRDMELRSLVMKSTSYTDEQNKRAELLLHLLNYGYLPKEELLKI